MKESVWQKKHKYVLNKRRSHSLPPGTIFAMRGPSHSVRTQYPLGKFFATAIARFVCKIRRRRRGKWTWRQRLQLLHRLGRRTRVVWHNIRWRRRGKWTWRERLQLLHRLGRRTRNCLCGKNHWQCYLLDCHFNSGPFRGCISPANINELAIILFPALRYTLSFSFFQEACNSHLNLVR